MKNSDRRANVLVDLIQKNNLKIIAEVGVDKCAVLKKVLGDCKESLVQYWAIDPWVEWDFSEKFQKRTQKDWADIYQYACKLMYYFPQLRVLKMTSSKASDLFQKLYFDLVFIDAEHTYDAVKDDIRNWLPLIKNDGFITGHDYGHKDYPGVKEAVDEIFGSNVTIQGDKVWVTRVVH